MRLKLVKQEDLDKELKDVQKVANFLQKRTYGRVTPSKQTNETRFADDASTFVRWSVKTGSHVLDVVLHDEKPHGLPLGSIVEAYSPDESQGKSLLEESIAAHGQEELHAICKLQDPEGTYQKRRGRFMGIRNNIFLYDQMDILEDIYDDFEYSCKTLRGKKAPKLIIPGDEETGLQPAPLLYFVDTLTACETLLQSEGNYKKGFKTEVAMLMGEKLRHSMKYIRKQPVLFFWVNQGRVDVGKYGSPTTTAGGKALRFYARIRMKCQFIGAVHDTKNKKKQIGNRMRVTIVKNKISTPFGVAEFDVHYNGGIQDEASWFWFLHQVGAANYIAKKKKYKIVTNEGKKLYFYKDSFVDAMRDKDMVNDVKEYISWLAERGRIPMAKRFAAKETGDSEGDDAA